MSLVIWNLQDCQTWKEEIPVVTYWHLIVHLFDLFESISSRDAAGFQKRRSKLNMRLNHGKNGSKKMAPAAGFEPATKWLTEAVFEPGNTLFSLKDRSFWRCEYILFLLFFQENSHKILTSFSASAVIFPIREIRQAALSTASTKTNKVNMSTIF